MDNIDLDELELLIKELEDTRCHMREAIDALEASYLFLKRHSNYLTDKRTVPRILNT
jgi:hypothetical protein